MDTARQKEIIIELYKKNGKLFGKMVAFLREEDKQKTCKKCLEEFKGLSLLGLKILRPEDLKNNSPTPSVKLVPKKSREYKYNISLDADKRLVIRGDVGISLLESSTYWHRVEKS